MAAMQRLPFRTAHTCPPRSTSPGASAVSVLVVLVAAGCSSGTTPPAEPDAFSRECWPGGGTPTPDSEVEIGHGNNEFHPIAPEQDLELYRGPQGGVHFFLNARMRNMDPGNPADVLQPNPISHFNVYDESGERISTRECSYSLGYRDSADGSYEMEYGPLVQLFERYTETAFGQRLRIRVEVRDPEGRYAVDERWVRAVEVADVAPDASPPDAGPPDASPDALE